MTVPRLRRKPAMTCLLSPTQNFKITEVPQPTVWHDQNDNASAVNSLMDLGGLFDGANDAPNHQNSLLGALGYGYSYDGSHDGDGYYMVNATPDEWDYMDDGRRRSELWRDPRTGEWQRIVWQSPPPQYPGNDPSNNRELGSARQTLWRNEHSDPDSLRRRSRVVQARDPSTGYIYEREDSPTPEVHLQRHTPPSELRDEQGRRYTSAKREYLDSDHPVDRRVQSRHSIEDNVRNTLQNSDLRPEQFETPGE